MSTAATPSNLHSAWSSLFARALARSQVTEVVLSPGSRSTPLALAFEHEPGLRVTPVVDERSAGFYALGQARISGRPSVLVCTSGTAGAHYLPAIIEASEARLPMIVVTADRPWELQDAGAPQTIDQTKLFGDHVRHAVELGLPDAGALAHVGRIAARAVSASLYPASGPVHVNARFRKPLEPIANPGSEPWQGDFERWMERGPPRVVVPSIGASEEAMERLRHALVTCERGVIAVGPSMTARFNQPTFAARLRKAVARLAGEMGLPIFAEATSQARFGPHMRAHVAASFDALLKGGALRGAERPDLIIELFSAPISSGYAALANQAIPRILVTDHGLPDPFGTASEVLLGDPLALLEAVVDRIAAQSEVRSRVWFDLVSAASARADKLAADAAREGLTEASVAAEVVNSLGDGAVLSLGNSLPVRDIDTFGGLSDRAVTILHQRGASGIDGLIAGAVGARSLLDPSRPMVLVLGDVSARHDLGSIGLLADVTAPLAVVVVQNEGGRIFEELPIGRDPTLAGELGRLFITPLKPPQNGDLGIFAAVSRGFGVSYLAARDRPSFVEALRVAATKPHATFIEAFVPPDDGRSRRAQHLKAVRGFETARRGGDS